MKKTNEKTEREFLNGLLIDGVVYLLAFGAAVIPFIFTENMFLATAAFTATATVVIFVASIVFKDVSVYDPYWSVAPPVMVIAVIIKYDLLNVNSVVLLSLIMLWSVRLTTNWLTTYKGIGHEDWRYATYRKKYKPLLFQLISFVGLHFVPTIVVYAGLTSALLCMRESSFAPLSMVGVVVMLCAIALEFFSDRAIHRFLIEHKGEKKTCNESVWKYSRHPNYLGEMSFWTGLYLYFLARCANVWYMGLGFVSIIVLFLTVSIPMMEKHNAERRPDYAGYKAVTSMLFLLPPKKKELVFKNEEEE